MDEGMSEANERIYRGLLREMAALAASAAADGTPHITGTVVPEPGADGVDADGEFLFDDGLYVRLRPAAEATEALVEVYMLDLALVSGPARDLLFHAIGQCNAVGAAGRPFAIGVDERDYAVLFRRLPLAGMTAETLMAEMSYLVEQGRDVRSLLNQLALGTLPARTIPAADGASA